MRTHKQKKWSLDRIECEAKFISNREYQKILSDVAEILLEYFMTNDKNKESASSIEQDESLTNREENCS